MRSLTLTKDGHRYAFRYLPGSEDEIVVELMRLAEDADCNLDWLDAATLSFQVTQNAAMDCYDAVTLESLDDEAGRSAV
jgi:hypothetical protein